MKKIVSAEEAGKMIRENCSLMVGGFLRCGTPVKVIEEIIKNKTGNLTLIANDTSYPEHDRGRLIANRLVKKAIVGHIGTNPETGRQMNAGELEVELVPRSGRHTILFGRIEQVERKFDKLLRFYRNGLQNIGWDAYRTIDIRYKDQVVCKK